MDWQIIASLVVSGAALVAFFVMRETPKAEPQIERKIQGIDPWKARPAAQVDPQVIDRFMAALKAQSRRTT